LPVRNSIAAARRDSLVIRSPAADLWRIEWWTLSQRTRTFSEIPIEAAILDTGAAPIYQQIAPKAVQLQQLGMSSSAIGRRLGVTDKTAAKAIAWFE
jgi:hypothetical protein